MPRLIYAPLPTSAWKLAFHDETFECVADGFLAETKHTTLANACRDAFEEVMGTA